MKKLYLLFPAAFFGSGVMAQLPEKNLTDCNINELQNIGGITSKIGHFKSPFDKGLSNIIPVDYLQKSRSQKTSAWLLFSTGVLTSAITTASNAGVCIGPGCTKKSFPVVPVTIGVAAMIGSIPLFIASGRNKRKGRDISSSVKIEQDYLQSVFASSSAFLKMEKAMVLQEKSIINQLYPTVGIQINLKCQ